MTAVRQDAWTPDDDLILAEVTLRHIRDGSTQLAAFEEVGRRIGRTSAACGFRWNSTVRKRYQEAIGLAKQQRQKRNYLKKQGITEAEGEALLSSSEEGDAAAKTEPVSADSLSLEAIIRYLRQWKNTVQDMNKQIKQMEKELKEKDEKIRELQEENDRLQKQVNEVQSDYQVVNDDYKTLIRIMERARRMAFLNDEQEEEKARFKMDANGNLERIE
jgi:prespore-specific regulator